jgi:hypothetical protein
MPPEDDDRREEQAQRRNQDPWRNVDASGEEIPAADRHDGGNRGPQSCLEGREAFVGSLVEPRGHQPLHSSICSFVGMV